MREGGAYATGLFARLLPDTPTREVVSHEAKGTFQAMRSGGQTPGAKRKIIVYIATSADGYIARPDGSRLAQPAHAEGWL